MKGRRNLWPIVIAVAAVLALIGFGIALDIVRKEGWEGLWNRKKEFVKEAHPEAGGALEDAERKVRGER